MFPDNSPPFIEFLAQGNDPEGGQQLGFDDGQHSQVYTYSQIIHS